MKSNNMQKKRGAKMGGEIKNEFGE